MRRGWLILFFWGTSWWWEYPARKKLKNLTGYVIIGQMMSKLIRRILLGSQYVEGVATRQELENLTAAVLQLNEDRQSMAKQLERIERKVYRDIAKSNGDQAQEEASQVNRVVNPWANISPGQDITHLFGGV